MKDILTNLKNLGVQTLSVTKGEARAVNPYDETQNQSAYHKRRHHDIYILPPLPTCDIPDGTYPIERFEPKWQYHTPNMPDCWTTIYKFPYWPPHEGLIFNTIEIMKEKAPKCGYRQVLILKEQVEETAEERLNRFIGTAGKPDCPKCRGKGYTLVKTTMPDIPARRTCECTDTENKTTPVT